MGQLDLNAVRVLVHVARARSFRGAAKALRLPRTTVSRKVAELEHELGATLLRRTTREVTLTQAAEGFLAEAETGLAHLDAAAAAVTQADHALRGTVTVAAPVPLGQLFLAPLLAEFLEGQRAMRVVLRLGQQPVDLVRERVDLALRAGALQSSSATAVLVGRSRYRFVASPAYLRQRGAPRSLADLAEHDCLAFIGAGSPRSTWPVRRGGRTGALAFEARLAADDFLALRAAAVRGLGVAQLPESLVHEALRAGTLSSVLDQHAPPSVPLHLVHLGGRRPPARVRALIDFLQPRLRRALAGD